MKRSKLRLSLFTEFFVYLVFGILLITGVAWMVFQARLDEGNHVSSLMLKLHGGAAMISLILLGALINHMRKGWKARRNRSSGLMLVLVILFLVITGYGLYYAGDEQLRSLISQWHAWIGLGLFLLLPLHALIGRALVPPVTQAAPACPANLPELRTTAKLGNAGSAGIADSAVNGGITVNARVDDGAGRPGL